VKGRTFPRKIEVITAAGPVPARAPRVNDKRTDPGTGERETVRFGDPARTGTQVAAGGRGAAAAVPALHGLSSSDFVPVLTKVTIVI
jgi:putative transposase